ncbi:MAG: MBOAT family O-acyltransferase [Acidobacteriota bacterium]
MLFNALPFFVFLPIVYLAYWALPRRGQNLLLLAASYVFYGWWDWRFLSLIVFSSAIDYVAGLCIHRSESPGVRRAWLGLSLVTQLGILAAFKYYDFGITAMSDLLSTLGVPFHPRTLRLILPVGISFYTFQTLSYTIDVYRRQLPATRSAVNFFTFVAYFPQLVAGPIERAVNLLPQFERDRTFDPVAAADGCRQMLYGLFLKTVVADNLATVVDRAYANWQHMAGWQLALATYAFALQIYCDFGGYSHVAVGCSRLFGVSLMRNFAYPYFSQSPAELWHRWHISLSTWFRDYVYLPLGGRQHGPARTRINILATFLLSGLWHGAGFTFVIWGLIHGIAVAVQWWPPRTVIDAPCGKGRLPTVKQLAALVIMIHFTCAAWVFFRSSTVPQATGILGRIATAAPEPAVLPELPPLELPGWLYAFLGCGTVVLEWLRRDRPHAFVMTTPSRALRWSLYLTASLAIALFGQMSTVPFIYFQF